LAFTDFRVAGSELAIHIPVIGFAACNARGMAASSKRGSAPGDEKAFGQLDRNAMSVSDER